MVEVNESLEKEQMAARQLETVNDSGTSKRTVFILVRNYLPGFKGGGPIRSISNLVSALGIEFTFKVITLDRDLGATLPYPEVVTNSWTRIGKANVMYLTPGVRGLLRMIALLRSLDRSAVLYLNSFFSRRFSMLAIFMRRLGLIHPSSLVIAPRGEFSPGAVQLKSSRKVLYIKLSRWLGLYRGVTWHASTQLEAMNILEWFAGVGVTRIAPVISKSAEYDAISTNPLSSNSLKLQPGIKSGTRLKKTPGHLRVVFLSRISPKKNLLGALGMLQQVAGNVSFDIYGPLEDSEYWNACERVIGTLPPNILVKHAGEVEHDRVFEVFADYDLFLFPTLGENYGHVICESLGAGCPVLISDQTPWRDLENAGVGWDIPLHDSDRFSAILQQCVDADEQAFAALRAKAEEYARKRVADPEVVDANRKLFENAGTGVAILDV